MVVECDPTVIITYHGPGTWGPYEEVGMRIPYESVRSVLDLNGFTRPYASNYDKRVCVSISLLVILCLVLIGHPHCRIVL